MALSRGARPERTAAAEKFYDPEEAAKYEASARMAKTQRHLSERALHLLQLKQPHSLLLDLGCGTGGATRFSGAPLERAGHAWIGLDLSEPMLQAARAPTRRRDVVCADIGAPLWLRKRVFDGAVSISAVQWLCHATKQEHKPEKRVRHFFRGLKAVLVPGARAVLQLYPEQPAHMEMIHSAALSAGFTGALVIDYPRSERSKKLYLVLTTPNVAPPDWPAGGAKGGGKGAGKGGKDGKDCKGGGGRGAGKGGKGGGRGAGKGGGGRGAGKGGGGGKGSGISGGATGVGKKRPRDEGRGGGGGGGRASNKKPARERAD